jgi:hypothetical protein
MASGILESRFEKLSVNDENETRQQAVYKPKVRTSHKQSSPHPLLAFSDKNTDEEADDDNFRHQLPLH